MRLQNFSKELERLKNIIFIDMPDGEKKELKLYNAGLPHFPRNFTRDSILSSILFCNPNMLRDQLIFCALRQGKKQNSYTGEEPGKIFHEYPGVEINGLSTEFNACDTTALFLIGHEIYQKLAGDNRLVEEYKTNIIAAAEYIVSHLNNGLFVETPELCNAKRFALSVTYWKDSKLPNRENGNPVYPVTYTLAHIQNMCALRSASKLLNSEILKKKAEEMKRGLQYLWDKELGVFYIGIDKQGPIRGISSDSLHALFYLEKNDISTKQLEKIVESSQVLKTPVGYRTLAPELAEKMEDMYHANTVWPFEQAFIYMGARKFGVKDVAETSSRIVDYLENSCNEIFIVESNGKIKEGGCEIQLWTSAAKSFFEREKNKGLIKVCIKNHGK